MSSFPGFPEMGRLLSRALHLVVLALLRGYQRWLSPLLAVLFRSGCRFHPTCSEYAVQAIESYGLRRGAWRTLGRLSRCHPFHPGGHDPP